MPPVPVGPPVVSVELGYTAVDEVEVPPVPVLNGSNVLPPVGPTEPKLLDGIGGGME